MHGWLTSVHGTLELRYGFKLQTNSKDLTSCDDPLEGNVDSSRKSNAWLPERSWVSQSHTLHRLKKLKWMILGLTLWYTFTTVKWWKRDWVITWKLVEFMCWNQNGQWRLENCRGFIALDWKLRFDDLTKSENTLDFYDLIGWIYVNRCKRCLKWEGFWHRVACWLQCVKKTCIP